MNKRTSQWAFLTFSPTHSEIIQRVAFTFGYKWYGVAPFEPMQTDKKVIAFDPERKDICWGEIDSIDNYVCEKTGDVSRAMELFKNPPVSKIDVGQYTVFADGSIVLNHYNGITIPGRTVDKLMEARKKIYCKQS